MANEPVVLDGGDRRCVLLLIELRGLVDSLTPGTTVHLRATDPAAPIDLPAWCHLTGHTYLGVVGDHVYGVRVAERGAATEPDRPWHVKDSSR
ncbi:sulfurtransferase TusA family protein [Herbidospora cretacea]|uniref:sulfurtransferase TusA family protein n=1 Tax=Herbidospora cretacea TaxID=28444 RepID=UPI000773B3FC|nr:sulfurtransferase TusA family protein [Herbidospora cretacea]